MSIMPVVTRGEEVGFSKRKKYILLYKICTAEELGI